VERGQVDATALRFANVCVVRVGCNADNFVRLRRGIERHVKEPDMAPDGITVGEVIVRECLINGRDTRAELIL
jgi:hypothetical protein